MNSIRIKSTINALKKYLSVYKSIFYKRSFENFQLLIISITYMQEANSIKLIYDKFIKKYWNVCLNRFYYFLSQKNFNISELAIATINISMKLISNDVKDSLTIYLIVDDTLQSKFGTKFAYCSKLFDYTSKNGTHYLNGHCFVCLAIAILIMCQQNIMHIKFPIQYRVYDKSKSKHELAYEIIESTAPSLKEYQVIVTCDSWYTKKHLLQIFKRLKISA